jgi:multicomponent Na+:H+ antiporter subunit A
MGDDRDATRLAALLVLFAAAMLGLVWSADLLGLFVFWEATTVVSFLLVGFSDEREQARAAAWQALLVTGAGGLALLGGLVLLGVGQGTWSVAELAADPPAAGGWTALAAAGVLLGAFTKSAQVPAHGWLLGAMAAPTPVSSYLHSATMVAAGVWLVLRLDPVFGAVAWWGPALVVVGGASALWGGWRALSAVDLKRLLAWSTISALGLMFAIIGIGTPKALFSATAVLVAHALYKAALFMGAGTVDHQCGTRDLREIGGLRRDLPTTALAMGLAALSAAAVPATAGFVAKEAALVAGVDAGGGWPWAAVAVIAASGVLSVAYSWRLWAGTFLGERPGHLSVAPPPPGLRLPAAVLGLLGLVVGIAPGAVSEVVAGAAGSVLAAAGTYELVAWPGLGLPLAISLCVLAGGAVLARRSTATADPPEARIGFGDVLAAAFRGAHRVAAVIQPGSLPAYVAVIATVAAVPAAALVLTGGLRLPRDAVLAAGWSQGLVAVLAVSAAVGVVAIRSRIGATVALGAVGYAVAALFWSWGAPDLALTQVLVETVVVAAFVLVFRRLPAKFTPSAAPRPVRVARLGVAGAVSAAVLVLVLATAGAERLGEAPTGNIVEAAEPVGGGRNLVNVILTDVRALDTLGEVAVVAAAAIGALALGGLAGRRLGRRPAGGPVTTPVISPRRSLVLEALVRGAFPLVVTFSLFLLVAGHNAPGGGFIAGLVAGAAVALRLLTGDWIDAGARPRWLQPQPLLGAGLAIAVGTLLALGIGGGFADQVVADWSLPVLGKAKATSALAFDVGVYLLVLGAVLSVLDALSSPAPDPLATEAGP